MNIIPLRHKGVCLHLILKYRSCQLNKCLVQERYSDNIENKLIKYNQ